MTFVTLEAFDEVAKAIADCAFVASELPVCAVPMQTCLSSAQISTRCNADCVIRSDCMRLRICCLSAYAPQIRS